MSEVAGLATSVAAPWGAICLAVTRDGLAALEFMADRRLFLERLERRIRGRVRWIPGRDGHEARSDAAQEPLDAAPDAVDAALESRLRDAADAVERRLAGEPGPIASLPLDLSGLRPWDALVLGAVRSIPWGSTASYGEVARMIGRAGAARAVGGAVGRNPIGMAIPCHRVIAGDGTIGGYGGGWWGERETLLGVKRRLLAQEGVTLRDGSGGSPRKDANEAPSRR